PFWTVDTLFYTEVNDKIVFPRYIYYVLSQIDFNYYNEGTTIPSLRTETLNQLEILVPSKLNQKKILNAILPIDRKIKNNHEMIDSLEQLAQTLFKRWFVDFEFPNANGDPYKSSGGEMVESELGIIPAGWNVGKIKDVVSVKSGYAFKSTWWTDKGDSVIKIKNINSGTISTKQLAYVSKDKALLAKNFEVYAGDIVIALTGATLGKVALVPKHNKRMLVNQRVGKFFLGGEPLNKIAFIHCLITNEIISKAIIDRGSGSAQANLSPSNLESINIVLPNQSLISRFNKIMNPSYEKITSTHYEISELQVLRNTLLPKLLSGEIELPDETEVTENVPIS
ncbi:MAG: restriction endonuclease subunit S, partial [Carnobacterium sp.]|nr:restriction endonuclease subunit S [Carnobacterium sp.]